MLNHQKQTYKKKKEKEKKSNEATLKIPRVIKKGHPNNKKSQKLWLSHVQVSLAKGMLETGLIEKKAMQNKPTFKIYPFYFKHS